MNCLLFLPLIILSLLLPENLPQNSISIGDNHAGGIVFYLDVSGNHGMVAASFDQTGEENGEKMVRFEWGCPTTRIIGADESRVGSGPKNTLEIEKGCETERIAADVCWNLYLNGLDNWFLPSKDELDLIYKNLHKKGLGKFAEGSYWSSTERSTFAAWSQNFGGGAQNVIDKSNMAYVRAARAF